MPWSNDREARRRSDETYNDPEYRKNRAIVRRRANGRCEQCGHKHPRTQCDHKRNSAGLGKPDHSLANLWMLCAGEGSCKCHEKKTAQEGGGYRQSRAAPDPGVQPRTKW